MRFPGFRETGRWSGATAPGIARSLFPFSARAITLPGCTRRCPRFFVADAASIGNLDCPNMRFRRASI
jgi:hypothetical protein